MTVGIYTQWVFVVLWVVYHSFKARQGEHGLTSMPGDLEDSISLPPFPMRGLSPNQSGHSLPSASPRQSLLIKSQDSRNIGDYAIGDHLTAEEVREMMKWAEEFIRTAETCLKQAF